MDHATLRALLEFHDAFGADAVVGAEAVDRFAASLKEREARTAPLPSPSERAPAPAALRPREGFGADRASPDLRVALPPERGDPRGEARSRETPPPVARPEAAAPVAPDQLAAEARAAARAATDLDALRAALEGFDGLGLKQTARRLVFEDGHRAARLMFVGEAPGREEDEIGRPFVGRSGQLLDRMLAAIGLDRTAVYIANVVPWRPPGNRTPTPHETEICRPFIERQVELVGPDVLVFLGGAAATALTGTTVGILKLRGKWLDHRVGDRPVKAIATLHPAYLLRQPLEKRKAWRDFLMIKAALEGRA